MNKPSTIQLNIAGYEIHPIPTGLFGLDGGAMFGTVPKVLWEKTNPTDDQNRIQMEARGLLLKNTKTKKNILIDTGNGSDFVVKYGEKLGSSFTKMYNVSDSGPSLIKSLQKFGIGPNDITDVILTHLHFDHAGGATKVNAMNEIVPTFTNAVYHLQRKNLETAKTPNRREKASYFSANFEPLVKSGNLKLVDGDQKDLFPGVSVKVSNGHTQGHQMVIVEDELQRLVYCGDVIPTSTHIRSAWIMGYDLNPLLLIEEKRSLMSENKNKPTYYFFEHDPYCDLAEIEEVQDDFKVKERFLLAP
jgi:glyoxylase-like metal-dependent hydrolase (beta-lactamase superfamily II)